MQRLASRTYGGDRGTERRVPRPPTRALKASADVVAIHRSPVTGSPKTSSPARWPRRRPQRLQRHRHFVGHGNATRAANGFRAFELATNVGLAHAELPCFEVNVSPAQSEELALAHAGHRSGEVERTVEQLQPPGRDPPVEHGDELLLREVTDVCVRLGRRKLHERAWVLEDPPPADRDTEQRMQRACDVPDRLGCEPERRKWARNRVTCPSSMRSMGRLPKNGTMCTRRCDSTVST